MSQCNLYRMRQHISFDFPQQFTQWNLCPQSRAHHTLDQSPSFPQIQKVTLADISLWPNTRNRVVSTCIKDEVAAIVQYAGFFVVISLFFVFFFTNLDVEQQIFYPYWSLVTYCWICLQICDTWIQSVFNKC